MKTFLGALLVIILALGLTYTVNRLLDNNAKEVAKETVKDRQRMNDAVKHQQWLESLSPEDRKAWEEEFKLKLKLRRGY